MGTIEEEIIHRKERKGRKLVGAGLKPALTMNTYRQPREGVLPMVMMERFGSPATRLMSVMKSFQVPVRSVQPGDRILVITDDAMDPLVWQGAMAAINEKGGEAGSCMWPRLAPPFADPPQMAIEAARGADAIFALTTTALSDASAGSRAVRETCRGPGRLMG